MLRKSAKIKNDGKEVGGSFWGIFFSPRRMPRSNVGYLAMGKMDDERWIWTIDYVRSIV